MDAKNNRIIYLIEKVENNTANEAEIEELNAWYATFDDEESVTSAWPSSQKSSFEDKIFQKVQQNLSLPLTPSVPKKKAYLAVAASLILAITFFSYFYLSEADRVVQKEVRLVKDVSSGREEATLTLADGSTVRLNNTRSGTIAEQAKTKIVQDANGFLVYVPNAGKDFQESLMNKVSTPIGGTYKLILPDGTKAWLNAASSIEFPSRFDIQERSVRTTGEVYFEVAQFEHPRTKLKIPFKVITAQPLHKNHEQVVDVLGTHFNINSYPDENSVRTTLLEGAVIVSKTVNAVAIKSARLRPGEQSSLNQSNQISIAKDVDLSEIIAWKDGVFEFNNTSLATLMRQFSRWYNIEIAFDPNVKNDTFNGKIERSYTLKEALKVLELGNVRFELVESEKPGVKAMLKLLP